MKRVAPDTLTALPQVIRRENLITAWCSNMLLSRRCGIPGQGGHRIANLRRSRPKHVENFYQLQGKPTCQVVSFRSSSDVLHSGKTMSARFLNGHNGHRKHNARQNSHNPAHIQNVVAGASEVVPSAVPQRRAATNDLSFHY